MAHATAQCKGYSRYTFANKWHFNLFLTRLIYASVVQNKGTIILFYYCFLYLKLGKLRGENFLMVTMCTVRTKVQTVVNDWDTPFHSLPWRNSVEAGIVATVISHHTLSEMNSL